MASHHPAGKRNGELARVGTSLVGVVVAVMATAALGWASGLTPIRRMPGADHGEELTPTAVAITPSISRPAAPIYPGGSGSVTFVITNRTSIAVQVTAVILPSQTTFAAAFRDPAETTATAGCTAHNSGVSWRGATGTPGSVHTLAAPLTVAAGGARQVTVIGAAAMSASSPPACQAAFFAMPSLAGITATPVLGPVGSTPAVDSWN